MGLILSNMLDDVERGMGVRPYIDDVPDTYEYTHLLPNQIPGNSPCLEVEEFEEALSEKD